jgi:AAA family ATP:ADP antiporter|tara:strand:+ start:4580 stop:5851 length:1272 start_codon:yes stop_codon:yes gene_type:complete
VRIKEKIKPSEIKGLVWAFTYFFCLLTSYYIIRPLRDEMGIAGGVENLPWLFTGTFLVMLIAVPFFGWVASKYSREKFIPYIYGFFIVIIVTFFLLFSSGLEHTHIAKAFYIWASVYNLFIISVFWSFMADIFSNSQAKRLYGYIAAGGTIGAISGPALTLFLVKFTGPINLLILSALLLTGAIISVKKLNQWQLSLNKDKSPEYTKNMSMPIGGNPFAGIKLVATSPYLMGICLFMLLYTTLSTFLYLQQAEIIKMNISDPSQRTAIFAGMDFAVNILTIVTQVFLTEKIINYFGLGKTLMIIPIGLAIGLFILGLSPILPVLIVVQVLRRAGNYAIMKPAREMLYVSLGREEKYKAKNFIDTTIYRGGDAVSAWFFGGLRAVGLGLAGIAFIGVPIALIWAWVSFRLGNENEKMNAKVKLT